MKISYNYFYCFLVTRNPSDVLHQEKSSFWQPNYSSVGIIVRIDNKPLYPKSNLFGIMNQRRSSLRNISTNTKYKRWIVLITITFLSNRTGHCMNVQNISGSSSVTNSTSSDSSLSSGILKTITQSLASGDSNQDYITHPFFIFSLLNFLISCILSILIISYLNSIALVQQCVLLYLYKDIGRVALILNSLGFTATVICYLDGHEHGMEKYQARLLSFGIMITTLLTLILINVVAILKLYMTKKMMVDPPMPWGDDDHRGIKVIRIASLVLVLGFSITMNSIGIYPKYNYLFTDHHKQFIVYPQTTAIFPIVLLFFIITFICASLLTKYFESANHNDIETEITSHFNYRLWIFIALLSVVLFMAFNDVFGLKNRARLYQLVVPIISILSSIFFILSIEQVKVHVIKTVQDKIHEVLHLNVKFVLMCLSIQVLICLCIS